MRTLNKQEFDHFIENLEFIDANLFDWEWDLELSYVKDMPLEICPEDIAVGIRISANRDFDMMITDLNVEFEECYDAKSGEDIELTDAQWEELVNELNILIV